MPCQLTLLLACSACLFGEENRARRPNVVLLIIDTLRADRLGCYGFPEQTSPELDEYARSGVQLDNVLAQCSWTRPSIGSMLTARYPRSIGLYQDGVPEQLRDGFTTLAEVLRANGYHTFGITANPGINSFFNFDQGFDSYIDSDVVWERMKAWDPDKRAYQPDAVRLPDSRTVFDAALRAARESRRRPIYIQINVMEVHEGWRLIRPEFKNRFAGRDHHWYLEAVRQVSFDAGRFISELLALPGLRDTLFVVTSDHGQGLADHPNLANSRDHGYLLYRSQLSVPLIFLHPGSGLRSRRLQEPVRLMDLMPTILDYLGIPAPSDVDGKSFLKLLRGEEPGAARPGPFVAETRFRDSNKIALYADGWEYIENRDGQDGAKRYELQRAGVHENGELTDRGDDNREVVSRMRAALESWERAHPEVAVSLAPAKPRKGEHEQLKALGYVGGR